MRRTLAQACGQLLQESTYNTLRNAEAKVKRLLSCVTRFHARIDGSLALRPPAHIRVHCRGVYSTIHVHCTVQYGMEEAALLERYRSPHLNEQLRSVNRFGVRNAMQCDRNKEIDTAMYCTVYLSSARSFSAGRL